MSGPSYTTYGSISVGSNVITIPAITGGQIIVVACSTPVADGVGNLAISGAGGSWEEAYASEAPIGIFFANLSPTLGSTSVTITAANSSAGVGSYIVTVWPSTDIVLTNTWISTSTNLINDVTVTTLPFEYAANQIIMAMSTAYEPFVAGTTPPTWSSGDTDNLVAYEVNGGGDRPIWFSYIQPSTAGVATYTSPEEASGGSGVAVLVWALPHPPGQVLL